jgi:hypothetical protein
MQSGKVCVWLRIEVRKVMNLRIRGKEGNAFVSLAALKKNGL